MRAVSDYSRREILHIRHYSLFTPRDFDSSPYFEIVKPTLRFGFDYKRLTWHQPEEERAKPVPAAEPVALEG